MLNVTVARWLAEGRTRWDVVVRVDGYVVRKFCLVDCLQNGQPLSDGCDADCLERLWI